MSLLEKRILHWSQKSSVKLHPQLQEDLPRKLYHFQAVQNMEVCEDRSSWSRINSSSCIGSSDLFRGVYTIVSAHCFQFSLAAQSYLTLVRPELLRFGVWWMQLVVCATNSFASESGCLVAALIQTQKACMHALSDVLISLAQTLDSGFRICHGIRTIDPWYAKCGIEKSLCEGVVHYS